MPNVRDVMTPHPVALPRRASAVEAARIMRDADVGPILVCENDRVVGILTDRDIALRVVAEGRDPTTTTVGDICSIDVKTLHPDSSIDDALRLMREAAVRRLPVVEDGRPVGIVALADLALGTDADLDPTVQEISAAPPDD